ncbi:hypothetical protein BJ875DRAFT_481017 [Amylocarpus encephaloides]|uniref:Glycine zipper domain-containing protein n=1 Tax=Amylocarpus encephaloides TaxID=45428 RepID=A0A9P7YQ32_9HELO|nr:hypothetical protein BJ875DRAFT_481017 [Amylocarpus encephaloides]
MNSQSNHPPTKKDDPWGNPYFMGERSEESAAKLKRSMVEHGQSEPIEQPIKQRKRARNGAVSCGNEGFSATAGPGGYNSGGKMRSRSSHYPQHGIPGPQFQTNEPQPQSGRNRVNKHQSGLKNSQPRNSRAHNSKKGTNQRQSGMGNGQPGSHNIRNQSHRPQTSMEDDQSGMRGMGAGIGKDAGASLGASMGATIGADIRGIGIGMGARNGATIGGRLGAAIGDEIEKRVRKQLRDEMSAFEIGSWGAAMGTPHGYGARVMEVEEDSEVEYLGERMAGQ